MDSSGTAMKALNTLPMKQGVLDMRHRTDTAAVYIIYGEKTGKTARRQNIGQDYKRSDVISSIIQSKNREGSFNRCLPSLVLLE